MKLSRAGFCISLLMLWGAAASAQPKPTPATIVARAKAGKVTLEFEGKPLGGAGVFQILQKLHATHNISRLDILVASELRLADIYSLEAGATKAGFSKYRVFAFDRDQRRLMPLRFGEEQVFTLAPK